MPVRVFDKALLIDRTYVVDSKPLGTASHQKLLRRMVNKQVMVVYAYNLL